MRPKQNKIKRKKMTCYFTVTSKEVSVYLPMSDAEMIAFRDSIAKVSQKEKDSKEWLESVNVEVEHLNEKNIATWREIAGQVDYIISNDNLKRMLESGEIHFVVNVDGQKRNMARTRVDFAKSEF